MSKDSVEFERLVARILGLIGEKNDTIIRDHHVPDPDTGTSRQVDILIERDGKKIFVECRDHARPQDVTWVETLIGRRESLGCDLIIGVSSSEFRDTAIRKAKAKGVILRNVREVSDMEIKAWGKSWQFDLEMVCYANLFVSLFGSHYIEKHLIEREFRGVAVAKLLNESIFEVSQRLSSNMLKNTPDSFSAEIFDSSGKPMLSNLGVHKSLLEGFGAVIWHSVNLPTSVQLSLGKTAAGEDFSGAIYENDGIAMTRAMDRIRMVITLDKIRVPNNHSWTGKVKEQNRSKLSVPEIVIVGTKFRHVNTPDIKIKITCPHIV